MTNEDKEFKRIGQIANSNGGVMNISADGYSVLLHFDFNNNQDINRFMEQLKIENIRTLASSSNDKSCTILI